MADDLPAADLIARISLAGDGIDRFVTDALVAEGYGRVGTGHGYVIQRLLTGPQQITGMASDLGVTQQAVSKTVKELVALDLARQTIDDADTRRRPVELTEHGHAMVARARRARAELERALTERAGARNLAAVSTSIDVLLELLGLSDRIATRTVQAPSDR